ncbi:MAG: VWA domain-containing protein, partial [Nitriliruptoraceae bacterium]
GRAGVLDVARTLERAMTTDGELVERAWRRRMTTPRRLVVLLDVSGSMAPYARALLRFAIAARRTAQRQASRRVEVFAFGTRLTRLSDELARRDVDAAIAAAAQRVVDWDGGTRIGASIDELVRTWGPRGVLRGSVVVICSDGLERGDPQLLGDATARLARHAHRIVWVNPLAGDERYEPVQRGIAAAMASVDLLLPGHDFASIEGLVETLRTLR